MPGSVDFDPTPVLLPEASGPRDTVTVLRTHGCWYPSSNADGTQVAFICDRGGVPQLWVASVDRDDARLLDSSAEPVTEVSWSPDGRWIAYTVSPGGGEHTRVLCVRPDGSDRRVLAGADPGSSAHLGCWTHDGSAIAVTVAAPAVRRTAVRPAHAPPSSTSVTTPVATSLRAHQADRDGRATLLGEDRLLTPPRTTPAPEHPDLAAPATTPSTARAGGTLSAYLIDPDAHTSPVLLVSESGAASLRVCDLSHDGTLALLRRGPRGRREGIVWRAADSTTTYTVPVADEDPWIGRFSPDGSTLWLRSNADREYAALFAVDLGADGEPRGSSVVAERAGHDLELLAMDHDGRTAVLVWNMQGASETEVVETLPAQTASGPGKTGPARPLALPHEVVTRVTLAGPGRLVLALSGSQRRPGVWWAHDEGASGSSGALGSLSRTPWSSRDVTAVAPGGPPVRPVPLRFAARDGLPLSGWYYKAPGSAAGERTPCVIHLHGGPEEQERPVFNPLYQELLGRGLDVFAPDVRGSSGHGRSFVDADLGSGRFAALDDVADCAAHLITAGLADPARLAVTGRSYGGYLTFASLVWHPDLFRTGVAVCGMSDFLTFFAGTEPWIAESAAHKYGHPEHDRPLLRALSPMSRIDKLRVPVLAVHGEHDTNVPPGESEQFVRAARERGVPAELLTLHEEGHDFLRADNRRLFRRTVADWMERYLRT
ncbi:prolyl oligopeptidase family serine peptidase [Streptomyces sp. NPDC051597]|uniref:prolyl oligopeptidase family serine peptidase n=1 Tax=Streptomyces sp. NPDC051597 TaxID=3155049 RepID=UPI00343E67B4